MSAKKIYCAWCGKQTPVAVVVWQDDQGRVFKYHGGCGKQAQAARDSMNWLKVEHLLAESEKTTTQS